MLLLTMFIALLICIGASQAQNGPERCVHPRANYRRHDKCKKSGTLAHPRPLGSPVETYDALECAQRCFGPTNNTPKCKAFGFTPYHCTGSGCSGSGAGKAEPGSCQFFKASLVAMGFDSRTPSANGTLYYAPFCYEISDFPSPILKDADFDNSASSSAWVTSPDTSYGSVILHNDPNYKKDGAILVEEYSGPVREFLGQQFPTCPLTYYQVEYGSYRHPYYADKAVPYVGSYDFYGGGSSGLHPTFAFSTNGTTAFIDFVGVEYEYYKDQRQYVEDIVITPVYRSYVVNKGIKYHFVDSKCQDFAFYC